MIRAEFKTRISNELESARKKRSKSIKEKSKSNKKDGHTNRSIASSHQMAQAYKPQKIGSLRKAMLKQNKPLNQNTPKNLKIYRGDLYVDDVQHMQSMKFISKECSSIKENHNDDCISFSNSGNNLDQFSPLFDRMEKENNSKQEFTLQICGIEDSDSYYRFTSSKDISFSEKKSGKNENSSTKTGKIKKNNIKNTISAQKPKKIEFECEILQIFKTLDHFENHILTKQNCSSQKLTTQLNYLIGSILNKIKVKNKQYDFNQFETEFKSLIEDSEKEEILEILENNRKKRIKLRQATEKDVSFEYTENNIIIEQSVRLKTLEHRQILSPQFKKINIKEGVSEKLSKISNKLNNYLAKNNLQGPSLKQIEQTHMESFENSQNEFLKQYQRQHFNQKNRNPILVINPINDEHKLKVSKSIQKHTMSTQNSSVSCNNIESFHKSHVTLKNNIEVIKKTDGSAFELNFTQLNKHLD